MTSGVSAALSFLTLIVPTNTVVAYFEKHVIHTTHEPHDKPNGIFACAISGYQNFQKMNRIFFAYGWHLIAQIA